MSEEVFVCGAGHQGLAMAAHLALNGVEVNLWNRTYCHIQEIIETRVIHCSGVVNGEAQITKVSNRMQDVVADFIMVTTPSSAHKDVAREIANYVTPDTIIVLNPGRTFGAIEFAEELKRYGVKKLPHIAETQSIIYTCRKVNKSSAHIFALKKNVRIAAIKGSNLEYILEAMPKCIKNFFIPADSIGITSFSNVGMVLHCAPVLMNVGWIESEKVDFKYYYDGISYSIARFLEKIDRERQLVAKAVGFDIQSVKEWITETYHVKGATLYECIRNTEAYKEIDAPPTLNTRYLYEDIPNGLVPIETVGKIYNISTPYISLIIDLACAVTEIDYREMGRKFKQSILEKYL